MKQPHTQLNAKDLQLLIAQRARQSRLFSSLTQEELAFRSQVSYATIRKFERTGIISIKSLLSIADTLGELKHFSALFSKADFINCLNPKFFKRPKRCKDGSFVSSRKMSERELYEYDE
jgi:transcriptional regulator with XRE-family HTH domain